LAGLAVAVSAGAAWWLHDPRSGAQYFRDARTSGAAALPSFRVDRPAGAVELAIARGTDPEALVRAALFELGGMEAFVRPGDTVVLKPNAAFDRPPALAATTRPEVLRAVARLCRQAGAGRVLVVDNPINQPEGSFHKSGLRDAAFEGGAELVLPRPEAFAPVAVDGEVLTTWPMLLEPLARAHKVIGLAPCKDHNLCGGSMTMKNWYGLLGGQRNRFHQRIHQVVADFAQMIQPTLVVLDGTRVLMRNGPTGGSLGDVSARHTLVAGTDMVSVDAFGYTLLDRDPMALEYLQRAQARGLGQARWQERIRREVQVG
jgi:uncharacterized protein (DUF362 family)